jgi:hypothetical protein
MPAAEPPPSRRRALPGMQSNRSLRSGCSSQAFYSTNRCCCAPSKIAEELQAADGGIFSITSR